jgi:hypothetical protein
MGEGGETIARMAIWLFVIAVGKHWWALMACAAFTILGIYVLAAHKTNGWALNVTFGLAGICLFIACYLAWLDKQKELEKAVSEGADRERQLRERTAELEAKLEEKTPLLTLNVHEVLVLLQTTSADIFIHASIGNARPDTQCVVARYEVSLERETIGQKTLVYGSRYPIPDLGDFAVVDICEELKNGVLVETQRNRQVLSDLAAGISHREPILHGLPHQGWFHFQVVNMPQWPMTKPPTGNTVWQSGTEDGDGNYDDSQEGWVEETGYVLCLGSTQDINFTIESPFGDRCIFLHSINTRGNRRIVSSNNKPLFLIDTSYDKA